MTTDPKPERHNFIPFGPVHGISRLSWHAYDRFLERTGIQGSAGNIIKRLEEWTKESRPAELIPGKVMGKMFANLCQVATYRAFGGGKNLKGAWILVIRDKTLVTVHVNESGEWRLLA